MGFTDIGGTVATISVPGPTVVSPSFVSSTGVVAGSYNSDDFLPGSVNIGCVDNGGAIASYQDNGANPALSA